MRHIDLEGIEERWGKSDTGSPTGCDQTRTSRLQGESNTNCTKPSFLMHFLGLESMPWCDPPLLLKVAPHLSHAMDPVPTAPAWSSTAAWRNESHHKNLFNGLQRAGMMPFEGLNKLPGNISQVETKRPQYSCHPLSPCPSSAKPYIYFKCKRIYWTIQRVDRSERSKDAQSFSLRNYFLFKPFYCQTFIKARHGKSSLALQSSFLNLCWYQWLVWNISKKPKTQSTQPAWLAWKTTRSEVHKGLPAISKTKIRLWIDCQKPTFLIHHKKSLTT